VITTFALGHPQILGLLARQIEADFRPTDTQPGWLMR
jgi:hypothetical protein